MRHKLTIDKYLDRLAARTPVPGGGSAAALVGAIGMALLSMVARYAARGNNRGAPHRKLSQISEFAKRSQRRLRQLMGEDEAVYLRLSKGMKRRPAYDFVSAGFRRGAKRRMREGSKNITGLYKNAAEVPREACAILQEGLKRCEELGSYCKTSLVSDLVEAALLLEAGFLSAKANVDTNLDGITDKMYTKKMRSSLLKQKISVQKAKKRIMKRWRQL